MQTAETTTALRRQSSSSFASRLRRRSRREQELASRLQIEGEHIHRLRRQHNFLSTQLQQTRVRLQEATDLLSIEKAEQIRLTMEPGLNQLHDLLLAIEEELQEREARHWEDTHRLVQLQEESHASRNQFSIDLLLIAVLGIALWFLFK